MQLSIGVDQNNPLRIGLAVLAVLIIAAAITISKRRTVAVGSEPATTEV